MIERRRQLIPPPTSISAIRQQSPENVVASLTPMELLGLDKPRELLSVSKGEAIEAGKAVAILMNAGKNRDQISNSFLKRFGLTPDVYDAATGSNTTGICTGLPATAQGKQRLTTDAILGLLGISPDKRTKVFGYSPETRRLLSAAYNEAVNQAEKDRALFPFRNLDKFPKVKKALDRVAQFSSVKPENIFKENRVPIAFPWQNTNRRDVHTLLLDVALSMIALALEEKEEKRKNVTQIAKEHRVPHRSVQSLLTDSNTSPLSDEMFSLVNKRIKRG